MESWWKQHDMPSCATVFRPETAGWHSLFFVVSVSPDQQDDTKNHYAAHQDSYQKEDQDDQVIVGHGAMMWAS